MSRYSDGRAPDRVAVEPRIHQESYMGPERVLSALKDQFQTLQIAQTAQNWF